MADWKGGLRKVQRAIDVIQANPVFNEMASDALKLIPVGGPILAKYWDKYKESKETDPKEDILNALKTMNRMNEIRLEAFCQMLEHNTMEVLKNQKKLNELVFLQQEILDEIKDVKVDATEIKINVKSNQEKLNQLIESVKIIHEQLGIKEIIIPDQKIEIPEDVLAKIKQKDEEIHRISKELEKAYEKPIIDIDYLLKEGNLYFHNKQYEKAMGFYDSILKNEPNHIFTLNNKGMILHNLGQYREAIECFDKALTYEPHNVLILNNKGLALHNLGQYREAIEWYDKALNIDSNFLMALNNKGFALNNLGQYREAIEWYDKALNIDSNFLMALNNKGFALNNLGQYREAIEWYDKALNIDSNFLMALNNKGFALNNLGQYREALKFYDKILAIKSNDILALVNKGMLLHKLGREKESEEIINKARNLDPSYFESLFKKDTVTQSMNETRSSIKWVDE